jgi:hypothetical protein
MEKDKQKQIITEIMNEDAKDELYEDDYKKKSTQSVTDGHGLTAVEWLVKEIKNFDSGRSEYYSKVAIYNHAYRMEKEQIKIAWLNGASTLSAKNAEQYYNETYNK